MPPVNLSKDSNLDGGQKEKYHEIVDGKKKLKEVVIFRIINFPAVHLT